MGLDIRIPIGLLFAMLGLILASFGFASMNTAAMYQRSLSININLVWGVVLLLFGILMLGLAWWSGKSEPVPTETRAKKESA